MTRASGKTLDSVLQQDMDDLEVIVADDASSDETDDVMRRYAEKDSRIQYTRHADNLGMVENWNWCLERAQGRYVKYLLADDKQNTPDALRRMADALDKHEDAALAVSARSIIDESSNEVDVFQPLGKTDRTFSNDWMIRRYLDRDAKHVNPIGEPSAVMFRREFGSRGFDTSYRQLVDVEMWFHLLQQGSLVYLADSLCCFRRHPDQQTKVNKRQYLHQKEEVELCRRYSHPEALRRVLFHKMYRISKLNEPALSETLSEIRSQYTAAEYLYYWGDYKLTRPFVNMSRSLKKRRLGDQFMED